MAAAVGGPAITTMKAALVALSFPVLLTITALSCWYDARAVLILVFFVVLVVVQAATRRQGEIEHLPTIVTGPATGETLFFIHGWPDNASVWDAQVHHKQQKKIKARWSNCYLIPRSWTALQTFFNLLR